MTDSDFDRLLTRGIRSYAEGGVRRFDAVAIAEASIPVPGRGPSTRLYRLRMPRAGAIAFAVLLLALALIGGAILVGSRLDLARLPQPARLPQASTLAPQPSPLASALGDFVPQPSAPNASLIPRLSWATGRLAYSIDGDVYIAATDGSDPVLVAEGTPSQDGFFDPRWSPDGRFLAYSGQGETFYVVDPEGRPISDGESCCIAWSQDSSWIAGMVGFPGGSNRPDAPFPEVAVVVSAIDGTAQSRVTLPRASLGNIVRVHWTPDGGSVVVSRVPGALGMGGGRTWLVPLNGDPPSAFPVEPAYAANTIFSPDGSRVVGVANDRLVVAAADGSAIRPLIAPKDLPDQGIPVSPTWSPDGDLIAIAVADGFAIVDVATGRVRSLWPHAVSADGSVSYAGYVTGWSADGERLLVETYDPTNGGLWSIDVSGSDRLRLVEGEPNGASWQWLPSH